jgi:hypothetical protein
MSKLESLYERGMKIITYSQKESQILKKGWHRDGVNIEYKRNNLIKSSTGETPFSTLKFEYDFAFTEDTVYFAYNFPYTYSDLMKDLDEISKDRKKH